MPDSLSPIDLLMDQFEEAPFRLAPERAEDLRELVAKRKIVIKFDRNTLPMVFEGADLFGGVGLIYVGVRGLERLWAFAYGIAVVRRFIDENGKASFQMKDAPQGPKAAQLIDWAVDAVKKGDNSPWPSHLPKPEADSDIVGKLANTLFVGAAGFAVLHEIGHIVLDHRGPKPPKDVSFRHEFEADEWAYKWIMDRWREQNPSDYQQHTIRATFISSLFSLIAINAVYSRKISSDEATHPNVVDRCLRFLIKHANEDAGFPSRLPWSVPALAIQMHLSEDAQKIVSKADSYRSYFNLIRGLF